MIRYEFLCSGSESFYRLQSAKPQNIKNPAEGSCFAVLHRSLQPRLLATSPGAADKGSWFKVGGARNLRGAWEYWKRS